MTFMEHIRIDQKQILNSIWANTYQAKEKRLGIHIANLLRSHWRTSNVKPNETKGPAKRIQHHPTLLNPTLLDDVAQC